jgi:hypothetical protein
MLEAFRFTRERFLYLSLIDSVFSIDPAFQAFFIDHSSLFKLTKEIYRCSAFFPVLHLDRSYTLEW